MIEYFIKFVNHLNGFWKYLHFAIYWYNYKFFTNKVFNHLISISKWDFFLQFLFLGFEILCSKYYLQKSF